MCKTLPICQSTLNQLWDTRKVPFWNNFRHFPNAIKICRSLPYGILTAETALRTAYDKKWLKELVKEIPEAKWEIYCVHSAPTPLHFAMKMLLVLLK